MCCVVVLVVVVVGDRMRDGNDGSMGDVNKKARKSCTPPTS
jgi:hypothetical protein